MADDHTPVEFSTAFSENEPPAVRIMVEPVAERFGRQANLAGALRVLDTLQTQHGLDLGRFDLVRDLFLPDQPQGDFALWFSLVLRPDAPPTIKVYLNPEVRGASRATGLVREALTRLGLGPAHTTVADHALRRAEGADRYSFFALDLVEPSRARVKVYVSHHAAEISDVKLAASAAHGVDVDPVSEFCELAGGGTGLFNRRPLVSSYTFMTGDTDRPSGYSLYVPLRDYVEDDVEARERVLAVMNQHRLDPAPFNRALESLARRRLANGAGLIAHVSLRMGKPRSGVTVYLSSEAYEVTPPRTMTMSI